MTISQSLAREQLATVLLDIERNDTNYTVRYPLVFRALALAPQAGFLAGVRVDEKEQEWPVAYIELPTGQVSWHVPQHLMEWDGHTTEAKYDRIRRWVNGLVKGTLWVHDGAGGKVDY